MAMAFSKKYVNEIFRIVLVLSSLLSTASAVDCQGKSFQCVNSTHFMICVDLGGGVSHSIDDFFIPCPPPTICQGTNHFECEFPAPAPPSTTISDVISESTQQNWEDIVTATLPPGNTTKEFSEKYVNTDRITTVAEDSFTTEATANLTAATTTDFYIMNASYIPETLPTVTERDGATYVKTDIPSTIENVYITDTVTEGIATTVIETFTPIATVGPITQVLPGTIGGIATTATENATSSTPIINSSDIELVVTGGISTTNVADTVTPSLANNIGDTVSAATENTATTFEETASTDGNINITYSVSVGSKEVKEKNTESVLSNKKNNKSDPVPTINKEKIPVTENNNKADTASTFTKKTDPETETLTASIPVNINISDTVSTITEGNVNTVIETATPLVTENTIITDTIPEETIPNGLVRINLETSSTTINGTELVVTDGITTNVVKTVTPASQNVNIVTETIATTAIELATLLASGNVDTTEIAPLATEEGANTIITDIVPGITDRVVNTTIEKTTSSAVGNTLKSAITDEITTNGLDVKIESIDTASVTEAVAITTLESLIPSAARNKDQNDTAPVVTKQVAITAVETVIPIPTDNANITDSVSGVTDEVVNITIKKISLEIENTTVPNTVPIVTDETVKLTNVNTNTNYSIVTHTSTESITYSAVSNIVVNDTVLVVTSIANEHANITNNESGVTDRIVNNVIKKTNSSSTENTNEQAVTDKTTTKFIETVTPTDGYINTNDNVTEAATAIETVTLIATQKLNITDTVPRVEDRVDATTVENAAAIANITNIVTEKFATSHIEIVTHSMDGNIIDSIAIATEGYANNIDSVLSKTTELIATTDVETVTEITTNNKNVAVSAPETSDGIAFINIETATAATTQNIMGTVSVPITADGIATTVVETVTAGSTVSVPVAADSIVHAAVETVKLGTTVNNNATGIITEVTQVVKNSNVDTVTPTTTIHLNIKDNTISEFTGDVATTTTETPSTADYTNNTVPVVTNDAIATIDTIVFPTVNIKISDLASKVTEEIATIATKSTTGTIITNNIVPVVIEGIETTTIKTVTPTTIRNDITDSLPVAIKGIVSHANELTAESDGIATTIIETVTVSATANINQASTVPIVNEDSANIANKSTKFPTAENMNTNDIRPVSIIVTSTESINTISTDPVVTERVTTTDAENVKSLTTGNIDRHVIVPKTTDKVPITAIETTIEPKLLESANTELPTKQNLTTHTTISFTKEEINIPTSPTVNLDTITTEGVSAKTSGNQPTSPIFNNNLATSFMPKVAAEKVVDLTTEMYIVPVTNNIEVGQGDVTYIESAQLTSLNEKALNSINFLPTVEIENIPKSNQVSDSLLLTQPSQKGNFSEIFGNTVVENLARANITNQSPNINTTQLNEIKDGRPIYKITKGQTSLYLSNNIKNTATVTIYNNTARAISQTSTSTGSFDSHDILNQSSMIQQERINTEVPNTSHYSPLTPQTLKGNSQTENVIENPLQNYLIYQPLQASQLQQDSSVTAIKIKENDSNAGKLDLKPYQTSDTYSITVKYSPYSHVIDDRQNSQAIVTQSSSSVLSSNAIDSTSGVPEKTIDINSLIETSHFTQSKVDRTSGIVPISSIGDVTFKLQREVTENTSGNISTPPTTQDDSSTFSSQTGQGKVSVSNNTSAADVSGLQTGNIENHITTVTSVGGANLNSQREVINKNSNIGPVPTVRGESGTLDVQTEASVRNGTDHSQKEVPNTESDFTQSSSSIIGGASFNTKTRVTHIATDLTTQEVTFNLQTEVNVKTRSNTTTIPTARDGTGRGILDSQMSQGRVSDIPKGSTSRSDNRSSQTVDTYATSDIITSSTATFGTQTEVTHSTRNIATVTGATFNSQAEVNDKVSNIAKNSPVKVDDGSLDSQTGAIVRVTGVSSGPLGRDYTSGSQTGISAPDVTTGVSVGGGSDTFDAKTRVTYVGDTFDLQTAVSNTAGDITTNPTVSVVTFNSERNTDKVSYTVLVPTVRIDTFNPQSVAMDKATTSLPQQVTKASEVNQESQSFDHNISQHTGLILSTVYQKSNSSEITELHYVSQTNYNIKKTLENATAVNNITNVSQEYNSSTNVTTGPIAKQTQNTLQINPATPSQTVTSKPISHDTNNFSKQVTNDTLAYSCINRVRGRYSDKDDCRKFYICVGNNQPIVGHCPENSVFSDIKKLCTKNMSHCIRENEFKCPSAGRFSDFINDNAYYICVNYRNHLYRFRFQCQKGYVLNKSAIECIETREVESNESVSISSSDGTSDTDSISNRNISSSTATVISDIKKLCTKNMSHCIRENEFQCPSAGRFSDFINDNAYYICVNYRNHLYRFRFQCQKGYVLNKTAINCIETREVESNESVSISSSDGTSDTNSISTRNISSSTASSNNTNNDSASSSRHNNSNSRSRHNSSDGGDVSNSNNISSKRKKKLEETQEKSEAKEDNKDNEDDEVFICKKEGKFPIRNECGRYYMCKKNRKTEYRRKVKKCDSDEVFDKNKKKCVDAESYEC